MNKKIIQIDEEICVGCGLCVGACKQGALEIIDGKAQLVRDDYCDGLGNCLPKCPVNAISFSDMDVKAKKISKQSIPHSCPGSNLTTFKRSSEVEAKVNEIPKQSLPCGCPGSNTKTFKRSKEVDVDKVYTNTNEIQTNLTQWPVQIKLVPINAPYFDNANLLIAADCSAYAYGNFHNDFMKNKITLIGCPKLDDCDYAEKLSSIIETNNIKSVMVVRMDVPCCAGIENAVKAALKNCTKMIPWQLATISTDGSLDGRWPPL